MRRVLLLLALGCSGGQTGEITEPTRCERVTETVPVTELEAEPSAALETSSAPSSHTLVWNDGSATSLSLTVTRAADTVDRLGAPGCASTWRALVRVDLATTDERLDVTLEGELRFDVGGFVRLRAEAATEDGFLVLVAEPAGARWVGTLTRDDAEMLATF